MSILATADALYQAKNYLGSGDWLDESASGFDMARGNTPVHDGDHFTLDAADQDYFFAGDVLDIDATTSLTVLAVIKPASVTGVQGIFTKEAGSTGWMMFLSNDGVAFRIHDGTNVPTDLIASAVSIGTKVVVGGRRDVAADEVEAFVDGVGSGSPATDTTTATIANTTAVRIGARGTGSFFSGDVYAGAVWLSALTDTQILQAGYELIHPGNMMLMAAS